MNSGSWLRLIWSSVTAKVIIIKVLYAVGMFIKVNYSGLVEPVGFGTDIRCKATNFSFEGIMRHLAKRCIIIFDARVEYHYDQF